MASHCRLSEQLLAAIDELTGIHAFSGNKQFFAFLVSVRITEVNNCKWSTTARIVDDIFDDTAQVAVSFGKIDGT